MKDKFGGVILIEFVGLKSKMYPTKKNDGKECNTAKVVNIATEFDKVKDVLFNEKNISHKIKRIQSKSINQELMKLTKYLSCFDDKKYVLYDRIRMLAYFHKDCNTKVFMCHKLQ